MAPRDGCVSNCAIANARLSGTLIVVEYEGPYSEYAPETKSIFLYWWPSYAGGLVGNVVLTCFSPRGPSDSIATGG
jgi:hypothetical protein